MELLCRRIILNTLSREGSVGIIANGVCIQEVFSNICWCCTSSRQRNEGLTTCKWTYPTRIHQIHSACNVFIFGNSALSKVLVRIVTLLESQGAFQYRQVSAFVLSRNVIS